jgi:uncharacterized membrane-anchored protein
MDTLRPLLELGVLAAALVLLGLAVLLQRRPDRAPDWPPSPRSSRGRRRDRVVSGVAVTLISAGAGMAALAAGLAAVGAG